MTVLSRYASGQFFRTFLFGLALFALLVFLGSVFDRMKHLAESPASFRVIFEFLWLEVPYWTYRVVPVATLLATLFAVGGFVARGEWTALQACGIRPGEFLKPILLCSLVVAALSFAAQETLIPLCHRRSQELWRTRIQPGGERDLHENIVLVGRPEEFLIVSRFFPKKGLMERVVLERYRGGILAEQMDAARARWEGAGGNASGRWILEEGVRRDFASASGGPVEAPFRSWAYDLNAPPRSLVPQSRNPEELSLWETRQYLRRIGHLGASPRETWVAVHAKLAYPFANPILCALGIPFALKLKRSGRAVNFALALAVSFGYLWLLETCRALGLAGRIPALLAGWVPNLAFGSLAFYGLRKEVR